MAKTIATHPALEECKGTARLRESPVRDTWWEQLLPPPLSRRGGMAIRLRLDLGR